MKSFVSMTTVVVAALWWTLPVVHAIRHLQFASPLQALTIPEHDQVEDTVPPTARARYLQKIQAGLQAEQQVRDKLRAEEESSSSSAIAVNPSRPDWAQTASRTARRKQLQEERMIEEAFEKAVAPYEAKFNEIQKKKKPSTSQPHKYQFVGVIQPPNSGSSSNNNNKVIQWYARPKPAHSKWSVRLVHVNRQAIIQDLFKRGKIDIFGKYENTGSNDAETGLPVIRSQYVVRERSWKNLWNFSPKHMFTDSSGMYWRERRLPPGLYTDGTSVYESSYRYRDGRNGMHRLSSLAQFLKSPTFSDKMKGKIQERLKKDSPDIVLEE